MTEGSKIKLLNEIASGNCLYKDLPTELKEDRELLIEALKHDGSNIQYASSSFSSDKEVILASLKTYEHVYDFMNKKFLDDEEVVLSMIKHYEGYLDLASLRIYKMCIKSDPIKVLTSIVGAQNLSLQLENSEAKISKKFKV